MKRIPVDPLYVDEATRLIKARPTANRGKYDGSVRDQIVGKIGELVVAEFLGVELPGAEGFDHGIDMVIGYMVIDVKTKIRRVPIKPWYAFNVPLSQYIGKEYKNNTYLFASYNDEKQTLEIAGYISKLLFDRRCIYLPVGAKRRRANGTWYPTVNGYEVEMVEIVQAALMPIDQKDDVLLQSYNNSY